MSHAGVLRAPLWPRGGRAEATVAGDPAGAHRVTQQGGGAGGSPRALRTEPGRFPDQQSWDSIPGPAEAAAEVGGGEGGRSLSQRRPSTVHASGVQDRVSCRREVSKSHRDRRQSREMAPPWRHTPKSLRPSSRTPLCPGTVQGRDLGLFGALPWVRTSPWVGDSVRHPEPSTGRAPPPPPRASTAARGRARERRRGPVTQREAARRGPLPHPAPRRLHPDPREAQGAAECARIRVCERASPV